jgi:hypothetical protein
MSKELPFALADVELEALPEPDADFEFEEDPPEDCLFADAP